MAKQIVLNSGGIAKARKELGMDSATDEQMKQIFLVAHSLSKLALDEDDKKAKDEDDKKSDAEDEEVEIVEDSEDDKKAKDEDKQTQADKDNESEAMRLKAREEREEKDRNRDKAQAQDMAMDAAEIRAGIMNIFKAVREVEPLVGVIALDGFNSDHEVYAYALKQKGIDTTGINTAGLSALVNSQKTTPIAMDSAPKGKITSSVADVLKKFR